MVDVAVAREVIARAILATRLAGRREPPQLHDAGELLPNLDHALSRVTDLYVCPGCGQGLPGGAQIALARGRLTGPVSCERCDVAGAQAAAGRAGHVERWIAVAQLMLDAGEPRRALALTARAEHDGATGPVLDRLRGWAHLALSNPTQAAAYLRRALEREPWELRTRTLLIIAEAQASLVSCALDNLDAIQWLPTADAILEPARAALEALGRGEGDAAQVRARCLAALTALEGEDRAVIMRPRRPPHAVTTRPVDALVASHP
jgi:hypothetical protein